MSERSEQLYRQWTHVRESQKGLHALEIATQLAVSECELLASACGAAGPTRAIRLAADWSELVRELPKLGQVKAVTRNPDAVIEVIGNYDNIELFGATGQSVGSVDLRIFLRQWRFGFAVNDETKRGRSRSLQFFDSAGRAIHKLFLKPESDTTAFDALIEKYRAAEQTPEQGVEAPSAIESPKPDSEIDLVGLRAAWRAMTDSHEFFGILRRFGVARTQALRLAGEELASAVALDAFEHVLTRASETELPFMTFVGNGGVVQIFTGAVKRVVRLGGWLNVLDPTFDLHVRTERIAEAWIVRKPTSDGVVTALELYDAAGQQIALLVGKRKPGTPESSAWRELVESVPRLPSELQRATQS